MTVPGPGGEYPQPMRPTRWLVLAAVAVTSALVSVSPDTTPSLGSVARAQDAEIKIGANLRAIQSVSLDDAVLADGHVVKNVPIDQIRKSFRLVG